MEISSALLKILGQLHPGWGRARNRLWSGRPRQVGPLIRPSQTEVTSDQTVPEQSGLWSGKFQTIVQTKVRSKFFPDHVIRAHREHVCARNSSDQGSLRSGHLDLGNGVWDVKWTKSCLFNKNCSSTLFDDNVTWVCHSERTFSEPNFKLTSQLVG